MFKSVDGSKECCCCPNGQAIIEVSIPGEIMRAPKDDGLSQVQRAHYSYSIRHPSKVSPPKPSSAARTV